MQLINCDHHHHTEMKSHIIHVAFLLSFIFPVMHLKFEFMILKDLQVGDKFIHANDKSKHPKKFIVKGNCVFNGGYGSTTRECIDLSVINGGLYKKVIKSSKLEIEKIGESIHKQKMQAVICGK